MKLMLMIDGSVTFAGPTSLANFEKLASGLKLTPSQLLTRLQQANNIKAPSRKEDSDGTER